jgi:hydrogenase maturation factor HypF (carbamoyltransferase family)
MKYRIIITLALTCALASGCSTLKSNSATNIDVEVEPDRSVRITNVTVANQDNKLKVYGTLRPSSITSRTIGHIHVQFVGHNGEVIEQLNVNPNVNTFLRKSNSKPRFSTTVALAESDVKEVRVQHHNAPATSCSFEAAL